MLGHKACNLVREDVGPVDQSQAPPAHHWQVRTRFRVNPKPDQACLLPPDGSRHTSKALIAHVATKMLSH